MFTQSDYHADSYRYRTLSAMASNLGLHVLIADRCDRLQRVVEVYESSTGRLLCSYRKPAREFSLWNANIWLNRVINDYQSWR